MDTITLFSRVPTSLLRTSLIRGSILAITGASLICLTGAFFPLEWLMQWGWIAFALGFGLITLGLLPYKRLVRLQQHPQSLRICSTGKIEYRDQKGNLRLTIPFSAISKLRCLSEGIGMIFFDHPTTPITLHHPPMDIESLRKKNLKEIGCDLFFPLFDRSSYEELQECLFEDPEDAQD